MATQKNNTTITQSDTKSYTKQEVYHHLKKQKVIEESSYVCSQLYFSGDFFVSLFRTYSVVASLSY